jgi:hypothetical protein
MPDPINTTASAIGLVGKLLEAFSWIRRQFRRKPDNPLFPFADNKPPDFEFQPLKIMIDLKTSVPYIEIDCYGINYLTRDLKVISADIYQLNCGPGIDQIPIFQEYTLPAKSSHYVCFRRKASS